MKWFLFQVLAWAGSIVAAWYHLGPVAVFSGVSALVAAVLDPWRRVQWWPGWIRAALSVLCLGGVYLAAFMHQPLQLAILGIILVLAV